MNEIKKIVLLLLIPMISISYLNQDIKNNTVVVLFPSTQLTMSKVLFVLNISHNNLNSLDISYISIHDQPCTKMEGIFYDQRWYGSWSRERNWPDLPEGEGDPAKPPQKEARTVPILPQSPSTPTWRLGERTHITHLLRILPSKDLPWPKDR